VFSYVGDWCRCVDVSGDDTYAACSFIVALRSLNKIKYHMIVSILRQRFPPTWKNGLQTPASPQKSPEDLTPASEDLPSLSPQHLLSLALLSGLKIVRKQQARKQKIDKTQMGGTMRSVSKSLMALVRSLILVAVRGKFWCFCGCGLVVR
jgi:hypothetical protein